MLSKLLDFKEKLAGTIDFDFLQAAHQTRLQNLETERYAKHHKALQFAKTLASQIITETSYTVKDHIVRIGTREQITDAQHTELHAALKSIVPWRKGPFEIFGERIDAEWKSDQKWERLRKHLGPLQGKAILDIGCNNGYYLYLMAKQNPKFVLGIDPTLPYYTQFQMLSAFCPPPNTLMTLHGFEHLTAFTKVFDVVFCMGIIYHHTDPIGLLRTIFNSMRPGGMLIVESMGIPGDGPYCLFPDSRYLGMPGHWFIPTKAALENLLTRAGFQYVETFFTTPMESSEQHKTEWAPYESYSDGLDPTNPKLTIEGHPAPMRFYVKARRARKGRF